MRFDSPQHLSRLHVCPSQPAALSSALTAPPPPAPRPPTHRRASWRSCRARSWSGSSSQQSSRRWWSLRRRRTSSVGRRLTRRRTSSPSSATAAASSRFWQTTDGTPQKCAPVKSPPPCLLPRLYRMLLRLTGHPCPTLSLRPRTRHSSRTRAASRSASGSSSASTAPPRASCAPPASASRWRTRETGSIRRCRRELFWEEERTEGARAWARSVVSPHGQRAWFGSVCARAHVGCRANEG